MAKCVTASTLGTPSDTYLYMLTRTGASFATIGSDDALRIFDGALNLQHEVLSAHSGISCLTSFGNGFATAGRDGVVRCWDGKGRQAGVNLAEPKGSPFSAIACHDHLIAAGTESTKEGLGDVSVLLYDTRNPSAPMRSYVESHTDTLTQLAFHPAQPNFLLSGSTDGLISLFDCSIQEEEDALQQVVNPRSAVHCAGFLGEKEVYVVTTDEHFSILPIGEDTGNGAITVRNFGDVRERLQCMYVVDLIIEQQPILVCGHNVNQTLSLVQLESSNGWDFGPVIDLPGAHGEEVVRDIIILGTEKKALSCGEDGQVKLWDLRNAVPQELQGKETG
jgi:WD40 repeat protein